MISILTYFWDYLFFNPNSQNHDITELFSQSFFDSAITTILGGFIYIFNLFLNIYIQPQLEVNR